MDPRNEAGEGVRSTLRVAVVTGAHPFEVKPFHRLWRRLPGVEAYFQDLDAFTFDENPDYDAVVLYLHHHAMPPSGDRWSEKHWPRLESHLSRPGLGIVVWHHAIPAFRNWPVYGELTGLSRRDFPVGWEGPVTMKPVASHPLVSGWNGCTAVEEWYAMGRPEGEPFLTTDHPKSGSVLGWTRRFRGNRVACLQPGHGVECWENLEWRDLFSRTLFWAVGDSVNET